MSLIVTFMVNSGLSSWRMVLMPLLSRLLTLLVILTMPLFLARLTKLNAWERAGADASSAGMVDAGFENQKELTKMQLDNQKEIAEMQNETQKEIAGIQSNVYRSVEHDQKTGLTTFGQFH